MTTVVRRDPRQLSGDRTGNLLSLDPPEHTRLRKMLAGEFTVRRMRRLEPRIVEIVDDHLDALERSGAPADLVAQYALPIPSLVICELLGVPPGDQDEFQARTSAQLDTGLPEERRVALAAEALAYMQTLVARARRHVARARRARATTSSACSCASTPTTSPPTSSSGSRTCCWSPGTRTTANMLGLGTLALLRHPEQLAAVRDDQDAVAPAVEELMRWLSIVSSGSPRLALRDVEIEGATIHRGDLVLFNLPAANRDPAVVDDPDRLDITRDAPPPHVAFGHGVHHCLGAPLARMEMRIAFPALLRRFPTLHLAIPDDEVAWATQHAIHGLERLPVAW